LNEQSVQEIAEITGLSVTNVKTKLFRLREQLRQELTASALDQH
jgi:DNA-directed RNA polymerase specialized sigma24 family protein